MQLDNQEPYRHMFLKYFLKKFVFTSYLILYFYCCLPQASSQVSDVIPVPVMSPSKMHGSMLKNTALSPLPSFVAKPKPVKDYSASKKLSISELNDKVRCFLIFVV